MTVHSRALVSRGHVRQPVRALEREDLEYVQVESCRAWLGAARMQGRPEVVEGLHFPRSRRHHRLLSSAA
jgi:hypothetical protein